MSLTLYAHPFSSYCMKVLIALYEREVPFELKLLSSDEPENGADFARLWPLQHMPLLLDGDAAVCESSIIIEHLDLHHGAAAPMISREGNEALSVRFLDRVFDNYVMTPMQRIVFDFTRSPETRDPTGVAARVSCWIAHMPGSTASCRALLGPMARRSAWPTALAHRRCFTPTGFTPSLITSPTYKAIDVACSRDRASCGS